MKSPTYYREKSADAATMAIILVIVCIAFSVGCFGTWRTGGGLLAILCAAFALAAAFGAWIEWRTHRRLEAFARIEAKYQPAESCNQNISIR